MLRIAAPLFVFAIAASGSAAERTPGVAILPWTPALAPPVFAPTDSAIRRTFAPDSLADGERQRLACAWVARAPHVDGRLEDWRLVRWNDLAGAGSVVRGRWTGPADLTLRFAVAWTAEGVLLGGRLRDEHPALGGTAFAALERVTLALACTDAVVQRYWVGGSRRFRIRRDGVVDAWTDLRNRRPDFFDAGALGVRGAARPMADDATTVEFELLVPWMAIFPLVGATEAGALANVIVEDPDATDDKVAAWSTRAVGPGRRPTWAALDWQGGPGTPGWLASLSAQHPDAWAEAVLWHAGGAAPRGGPATIAFGGEGARTWQRVQVALPAGGRALLRVGPLPSAPGFWPRERVWQARVSVAKSTPLETGDLWLAPPPAALADWLEAGAARHFAAVLAGVADTSTAFPQPADVDARLERALRGFAALGDATERRHHPMGGVAWRAARRARLERDLVEAEALRALDPRQGRETLGGVPRGTPVLRGRRSALDGSLQPLVLGVPESGGAGPFPLLVVLHDVDQDESSLLESTRVQERALGRGWVVASPSGRGNSGYVGAGEREVLDAIAAVRAALPIDGRRVYVTGMGMGGTGTWLLALRHPGLFAAASIVSGYADFEQSGLHDYLGYRPAERAWFEAHDPVRLLRAGMATAFRVAHGDRDVIVSPVHARVMRARCAELGIPLEFRLDPAGEHGPRFFDADLDSSFAFLARQARRDDGRSNPQAFAGTGPPLADVFARGPFAFVPGRAPEDQVAVAELGKEWRARTRGMPRVLDAAAVTPEIERRANLILVGTPSSHPLLARWADKLPVRWDPDAVIVNGTAYPLAKFGVAFAAVHPEQPDRTIVVYTGMQNRSRGLPRSPFALGTDWAVVGSKDDLVAAGSFTARP